MLWIYGYTAKESNHPICLPAHRLGEVGYGGWGMLNLKGKNLFPNRIGADSSLQGSKNCSYIYLLEPR